MSDIKYALKDALAQLEATSDSARLDAEVLLAYVLNTSRTYLYSHPEQLLLRDHQITYQHLLAQRAEGLPIAYITGTREFWDQTLHVNQDTLIPRPETELLVELTLKHLDKPNASILDLGTGSGAIGIALATERPDWRITASDICQDALLIARENAQRLKLTHWTAIESDWFDNIPHKHFDAILANPPYIAEHDPHLSQGDVRFEPRAALVSGPDGLDAFRRIIEQSYHRLSKNGFVLLEHGYNQKQAVTTLLRQHGFVDVQCWTDCQGNERVSGGW